MVGRRKHACSNKSTKQYNCFKIAPTEKYYFFNKKVTSFSYPVVKSRIPTLLYFLQLKKPESNIRFHETLANIIVFVKTLG
jgi:hypothetical protein